MRRQARPNERYRQLVTSKRVDDDQNQREVVEALDRLYRELEDYTPQPIAPSKGIFNSATSPIPGVPRSIYIYGDVGTGKTMVMDLFYHSLAIKERRRVHFHGFMIDIHARIHRIREGHKSTYDPIPQIADDLAREAYVLCLDEFQVTDIADAMILRRLMEELFRRGVVIVTTSNRHPDHLYKNGIQRKSFIPCIELIKQQCHVLSLDGGTDYRQMAREMEKVYFTPLNKNTEGSIEHLTKALTHDAKLVPTHIDFLGRSLVLPETAGNVARCTFDDLCGKPLSAKDYLELTQRFNILILTNIPKMTLAHREKARRFITLIDALYETHTVLVCSAEAPLADIFSTEKMADEQTPDHHRMMMDDLRLNSDSITSPLFSGDEEVFAFQRAISRLVQMQSKEWIESHLKK